jgi:hypothetical protein
MIDGDGLRMRKAIAHERRDWKYYQLDIPHDLKILHLPDVSHG